MFYGIPVFILFLLPFLIFGGLVLFFIKVIQRLAENEAAQKELRKIKKIIPQTEAQHPKNSQETIDKSPTTPEKIAAQEVPTVREAPEQPPLQKSPKKVTPSRNSQWKRAFTRSDNFAQAFILKELLDEPLAKRKYR